MKHLTKIGFADVRRLVEMVEKPLSLEQDNYLRDQDLRYAHEAAMPTVIALIDYYYKEIKHTGNNIIKSQTHGALSEIEDVKHSLDLGYRQFNIFLNRKPNILQSAMQHYEVATIRRKERLKLSK